MPKWAKILIGIVLVAILIIAAFLIYVNTAFISKDEVKESLSDYIDVEENAIHYENIDLEMDKNQYEVDFYYNNNEYEAKIDAKNGTVIYTDYPLTKNTTTNGDTTNNEQETTPKEEQNNTTNEITLEEAKDISLKHANLNENNVTLVRANEDTDDGTTHYEIEWRDATYEYDFDISTTGVIISYDKDSIHD